MKIWFSRHVNDAFPSNWWTKLSPLMKYIAYRIKTNEPTTVPANERGRTILGEKTRFTKFCMFRASGKWSRRNTTKSVFQTDERFAALEFGLPKLMFLNLRLLKSYSVWECIAHATDETSSKYCIIKTTQSSRFSRSIKFASLFRSPDQPTITYLGHPYYCTCIRHLFAR